MVKYNNSLVLGKMYPPTMGHLYLIDSALENSISVNVMVCHNKSQTIPGELRVKAIKDIYQNDMRVTVHSVEDDGLPQHDWECESPDEFYNYWTPLVNKYVKDLDAIFTSEDYGDDFARYLGVEHFLVDKERNKWKISATEVRNNPIKYWDFICPTIRHYFVKRIVIMGPESVGKSVLSQKLAKHYQTNFVEEYGRTVYENNGNSVSLEDFITISKGRQDLEDKLITKSNKFIFCDTEDITTYLFSKMFYPEEYKKIEPWFLNEIKKKKKYDLYILLNPDCQWVQDGTRSFSEGRIDHYNQIKLEMENRGCDFIEVGGDWESRFNKSIEIINQKFNI